MKHHKRRGTGGVLYRMLFGSDHQLFAWFELMLITAAAILIWVYQATLDYDRPQQYFFWPMLGPVLIALRYGFGRGMMSFVLLLLGFSLWQASHNQPYLLSMPVAVGTALITMLIGEFRDHWHDINERYELNHRFMEQKLKSFTQNYHLLKVSHDQLEQRFAGKQMSLRTGIQLLQQDALDHPDGRPVKLAQRSLHVLSDIITLYQAGFYLVNNGEIDPVPLATIGDAHKLVADDAMLLDMLRVKALLSPADLIEHSDLQYQLTIPLLDINGKLQAVILAEKVRFVQLTDANIALVALLSSYIANFIANEAFVPILVAEQRQPAGNPVFHLRRAVALPVGDEFDIDLASKVLAERHAGLAPDDRIRRDDPQLIKPDRVAQRTDRIKPAAAALQQGEIDWFEQPPPEIQELLARNHRAMKSLLAMAVAEEPVSFEDYICDDGKGYGPYKIRCTMWRDGDRVILDFEGTDPQSAASINFFLNENMFKMFFGIYMIMVFDPQILFNDGFYDLIDVRIPEGSLLKPKFPAALSGRTHALGRIFDILGGLLGQAIENVLLRGFHRAVQQCQGFGWFILVK